MTDLVELFVNNLLPIIIVAGAGALVQRVFALDPRTPSRITFYVAIPALVFRLLSGAEVGLADILRMVGFAATLVAVIALLAFVLGRALRFPRSAVAGLVLAAAFMNSGNYGLSLNRLALGEQGLAWASLFYVTSSLMNNSLGVFTARAGRERPLQALAHLLKVPAVYAIVLGMVVRFSGWPVPLPLGRSIDILGSAAIPLMLLLLGMQLSQSGLPRSWRPLAAVVTLRLLVSPALAWYLAPAFGLDGVARQAAILEAGMPTALLSSLIATEFDTEADFVGSAVLLTTLLSPLTLTPLLMALTA